MFSHNSEVKTFIEGKKRGQHAAQKSTMTLTDTGRARLRRTTDKIFFFMMKAFIFKHYGQQVVQGCKLHSTNEDEITEHNFPRRYGPYLKEKFEINFSLC